MEYFKDNPSALLDAIPTPRAEEQDLLSDFRSGLTPKKDFKMSFNVNDSAMNWKSSKNLLQLGTPRNKLQRLYSPKLGGLLSN